MVGETFLICSKEMRVEIKLWEFSCNLVIKTMEGGKLPKRKGVKGDELRTRDSFWQAHGGTVMFGEEESCEEEGKEKKLE